MHDNTWNCEQSVCFATHVSGCSYPPSLASSAARLGKADVVIAFAPVVAPTTARMHDTVVQESDIEIMHQLPM